MELKRFFKLVLQKLTQSNKIELIKQKVFVIKEVAATAAMKKKNKSGRWIGTLYL